MTMLPETRGKATLSSVYLPYFCDACDDDRDVLTALPVTALPERTPCPTCGSAMAFDDAIAAYEPLLSDKRNLHRP
jgi:hypothetical protein